jgi:hypothetical protein
LFYRKKKIKEKKKKEIVDKVLDNQKILKIKFSDYLLTIIKKDFKLLIKWFKQRLRFKNGLEA